AGGTNFNWGDPDYDERTGDVFPNSGHITEISEDDLAGWLNQHMPKAKPVGSLRRLKCVEWLARLRREGRQEMKKELYATEAYQKFGVTDGQFQSIWDEAAKACPSAEWGNPGAPKKNRVK